MWSMLISLNEWFNEPQPKIDYWEEMPEIAIIFNTECSCNETFLGKPTPEAEPEDSDFGRRPGEKVIKWIPKKRLQ